MYYWWVSTSKRGIEHSVISVTMRRLGTVTVFLGFRLDFGPCRFNLGMSTERIATMLNSVVIDPMDWDQRTIRFESSAEVLGVNRHGEERDLLINGLV